MAINRGRRRQEITHSSTYTNDPDVIILAS